MASSETLAAAVIVGQAALGIFFLPGAIAKVQSVGAFTAGVKDYQILPSSWVRPVAFTLPVLEGALGVALLLALAVPITGAVTAGLLTAYMIAVAINLRRGRRIDCSCYGIAATKRIGAATVARILSLWVIGLDATQSGHLRAEVWADGHITMVMSDPRLMGTALAALADAQIRTTADAPLPEGAVMTSRPDSQFLGRVLIDFWFGHAPLVAVVGSDTTRILDLTQRWLKGKP